MFDSRDSGNVAETNVKTAHHYKYVLYTPIYTTPQWAAYIRGSRHKQPYLVKEMDLPDFFLLQGLGRQLEKF